MNTASKHKQLYLYLKLEHKILIEEAYNIMYTDHELSDILSFEALQLDQKLKFLQF